MKEKTRIITQVPQVTRRYWEIYVRLKKDKIYLGWLQLPRGWELYQRKRSAEIQYPNNVNFNLIYLLFKLK